MYQVAICEESPSCCAALQEMLAEIMAEQRFVYSCDPYSDPERLENAIVQGKKEYQILLLDTSLKGRDGVEFAKKLRILGARFRIIFISSGPASAFSAYAAAPTHYILKPVQCRELRTALNRVFQYDKSTPLCVLKTIGKEAVALPAANIMYLEVLNKNVLVHCKDGDTHTVWGPLTDFCREKLPAAQFFICHRCYVVNLANVKYLQKYEFILENNSAVPVARRRYKSALETWANYLMGR